MNKRLDLWWKCEYCQSTCQVTKTFRGKTCFHTVTFIIWDDKLCNGNAWKMFEYRAVFFSVPSLFVFGLKKSPYPNKIQNKIRLRKNSTFERSKDNCWSIFWKVLYKAKNLPLLPVTQPTLKSCSNFPTLNFLFRI